MIGCGARGQELLEAAQRVPGVQIAAFADCYTGRLDRAKSRTGGKAQTYGNYKEVLARKDLDGVIVASPDHWHKQMAIEAMDAGKDVYVEKPLTYTVPEGLEIMAAVKRTSRVLQVGSQGISSATDMKARDIVTVRTPRQGDAHPRVRTTAIRPVARGSTRSRRTPRPRPSTGPSSSGSAPKRPFSLERFFRWRCYWDYSGGIAGDLFVHLLTTIHYVMGATVPASVFASGQLYRWTESREVPDTVNAVIHLSRGIHRQPELDVQQRVRGGVGIRNPRH